MPKKTLLISIIFLLVAASVAGWFVYRAKVERESTSSVSNVSKDNTVATSEPRTPADISVPSDIDTSDWKVYRNEEYGFEVKYPENLFDFREISDFDSATQIFIIEKGYSIDEVRHTIAFVFNQLESEKSYDMRRNGECINVSLFKGRSGVICGYGDQVVAQRDDYNLFLDNISCKNLFEIWFNERKRSVGDVFSSARFGCSDNPSLRGIYKAIYDSVEFFSPKSSN